MLRNLKPEQFKEMIYVKLSLMGPLELARAIDYDFDPLIQSIASQYLSQQPKELREEVAKHKVYSRLLERMGIEDKN